MFGNSTQSVVMKKILGLTLLILSPLISNSQTIENWQLGLDISAFNFGRSNPTARYEKANQGFLNGVSFGVTIEKNWNPKWGLKSEVEYSFQNRKDVLKHNHRSKLDMDFDYLKFPVTLQYSKLLSGEKNLY